MRARKLENVRGLIESEIERMISALDLMDGDCDIEESYDAEPCCEDEGSNEEDAGADIDFGAYAVPSKWDWRESQARQQRTTQACVEAVDGLRAVQRRNGGHPVRPLRVLGSATVSDVRNGVGTPRKAVRP